MKKRTKAFKISKVILTAILSILLVFTTSIGSSVQAITLQLPSLPLFDLLSWTVGTDANASILTALTSTAADKTITLKGEGTLTLSATDNVACPVTIIPAAGKDITIIGGNFSGTVTLKCPGSTEVVFFQSGNYKKIDITTGKAVLDGAIIKNPGDTPIVMSGGELVLRNSSQIIAEGGGAIVVNGSISGIIILEGCAISGNTGISSYNAPVGTVIDFINIGGKISVVDDTYGYCWGIFTGQNTTINNLNLLPSGRIETNGDYEYGIENRHVIGTMNIGGTIMCRGKISTGIQNWGGTINTLNVLEMGNIFANVGIDSLCDLLVTADIGSLSVKGTITAYTTSIQKDSKSTMNIVGKGLDIGTAFLWGKTEIADSAKGDYTGLVPTLTMTGTLEKWTLKLTKPDGTPVIGAGVGIFNAVTNVPYAGSNGITDASGTVVLDYQSGQIGAPIAMSYALKDDATHTICSSALTQPQFAPLAPKVNGIGADKTTLDNKGGQVVFSVWGSNLKTSSTLTVSSRDFEKPFADIAPIASETSNTVSITLPENKTGSNKVYTFHTILNGVQQSQSIDITVATSVVPVISGITASPLNMESTGGNVTFTLSGSNLKLAKSISIKSGLWQVQAILPLTDDNKLILSLSLPANTADAAQSYVFKPTIDGVEQNISATVTVAGLKPGTPTGQIVIGKADAWATAELDKAVALDLIPQIINNRDMTKGINREEFCELAVKLYEKMSGKNADAAYPNPFTDTTNAQILKAYKLGITNGVSASTFEPETLINREQCAAMLFRTIKLIKPDADYSVANVKDFSDGKNISGWAGEAAKYMFKIAVVKGDANGNFMPRPITDVQKASGYGMAKREEAIIMSFRIFEKLSQ